MEAGLDLLLNFLASRLTDEIVVKADGYCMRVDHLTLEIALSVCQRVNDAAGENRCYVLVAKKVADLAGCELNTERAIELRNRKPAAFILLVPTGVIDSTASSLRNAFAAFDLDVCWKNAQSVLTQRLSTTVRDYVYRAIRCSALPGISEEDRAVYCAAVAATGASPTAAASELYRVGLIPDSQVDEERLADNVRASRELVRPVKSHAALTDRLDSFGLQPGPQREQLEDFFSQRQLSDWRTWMREIAHSETSALQFSEWDLVTRSRSKLKDIKLVSWLDANGSVEKWSKLQQPGPGTQPFAVVGPKNEIQVRWQSDPKSPEGLAKWRIEMIPSRDFYAASETPDVLLPSKQVKGTLERTTLKLSAIDWPEDVASIVVQIRLTAISDSGGELLDVDDHPIEAISDECQLRPDAESPVGEDRSSQSLKSSRDLNLARLRIVADKGTADLSEETFHWSGTLGNVFTLGLKSRDRIRISYSPPLKELERHSIANPQCLGQWSASLVAGEQCDSAIWASAVRKPMSQSGTDFMAARISFFQKLADQEQRQWLAITRWDRDLEEQARRYVDAYVAWLNDTSHSELNFALAVDTGIVTLRTDGRTIKASINSPLHPLKVSWWLTYQNLVEIMISKAVASARGNSGISDSLDFSLFESIEPIGCPMLSCLETGEQHLTAGGLDFLWTVGLPIDWPDPERGLSLISQSLGVTDSSSQDHSSLVARIAGHVNSYLALHPHAKQLRVVTDNAGDGRFCADVLRASVAIADSEADDSSSQTSTTGPERIELFAHFRPPLPSQLPGMDSLRQTLEQLGARNAASSFQPLLETGIRSSSQLTSILGGGTHLTLMMDVTTAQVKIELEEQNRGTAALNGLLCPFRLLPGGPPWRYCVPDARPQDKLTQQIIQHQRALARRIGGVEASNSLPVLHVAIEGDVERLQAVHEQSDWVITLDRFVEPAWIESNAGMRYLLDYSPDVSDGLSRRLFVSTGHRAEAEQLLSETLSELGLESSEGAVTCVLHRLRQVSGRLALRAFGSSTSRREATALAIAVDYLLRTGELRESILIPVDAHMEVFAPGKKRGRSEKTRRCDLLAVSLTAENSLHMKLYEVKGRSYRPSPDVFATIRDQLESTNTLLELLWCDKRRIDRDLQLYRLRQILEYHLRRASAFDMVKNPLRWQAVLERLINGTVEIEMSMHGIIVCPGAMPETIQRGDIVINVIGDIELTRVGDNAVDSTTLKRAFVSRQPAAVASAQPITNQLKSSTAPVKASVPTKRTLDSFKQSLPESKALPAAQQAPLSITPLPDFGAGDIFLAAFNTNPVISDQEPVVPLIPMVIHGSPDEPSSKAVVSEVQKLKAEEEERFASHDLPTNKVTIDKQELASKSSMEKDNPAEEEVLEVNELSESHGVEPSLDDQAKVEIVIGHGSEGPAVWKPAVAGSPHLFIIGIPGQGKSVTTTRLLCELAKQNVPALVLDFHGEFGSSSSSYSNLADPTVMDAAEGLPFSILEPKHGKGPRAKESIWELAEICQYVCGLGEIQRDSLYRAFETAYETVADGATPLLKDVGVLISSDENEGSAKNVVARCRPLFEFGLFADSPSEIIYDQFRKGAVIDLHNLKSEALQIAAGAFTLRKLYRAMFSWGTADRIRLVVVLDEAHRLAKDLTLPRIMKEGRKFGVAVVVASQDIRDFHEQVLSNAGTKVVFRVNYPDSRKVAGFVRADKGDTLSTRIERLAVGEAIVQTPDMPAADWVRMLQVSD